MNTKNDLPPYILLEMARDFATYPNSQFRSVILLQQATDAIIEEEDDVMMDQYEADWQSSFREVWSHVTDLTWRDQLRLIYSLHNAMMAAEELRRYAQERSYSDAWRDAGTRFYECLAYLEAKRDIKGYDAEVVEALWLQGHHHQLTMLARYNDYLEFGFTHA